MNIHEIVKKILSGEILTLEESEFLGEYLTDPNMDPYLSAAAISLLSMRGETHIEIYGIIKALQQKMVKFPECEDCIDLAGTGGSRHKIGNISTMSAFVVASAGIKVVKHGNRSFNHNVGSADILEKLGVNIHMAPEKAKHVLEKTGITFLFAPDYHPALKNVSIIRKSLKFRTLFNIIGPFLNPANVRRQIIGFPDYTLLRKGAEIAKLMGKERVILVSSENGVDEIIPSGRNFIFDIRGGDVVEKILKFEERELPKSYASAENSFMDVLQNKGDEFLKEAVILNSALALTLSGKYYDLEMAKNLAMDIIESKEAYRKFQEFKEASMDG